MDANAELYAQIERFLAGAMDSEEEASFTRRMESDPDLAREVTLHREVAAAIGSRKDEALKRKLDAIHAAESNVSTRRARLLNIRTRHLPVAAALLICISALLYYIIVGSSTTSGEVFAEHFSPYPVLNDTRNVAVDTSTIMQRAFIAYRDKHYERSTRLFDSLESLQPGNTQALFYGAVSRLASGNAAPAAEQFRQLADTSRSAFKVAAQWYQALSYLALEDEDQARKTLEAITAGEGPWKSKAEQVLLQLD